MYIVDNELIRITSLLTVPLEQLIWNAMLECLTIRFLLLCAGDNNGACSDLAFCRDERQWVFHLFSFDHLIRSTYYFLSSLSYKESNKGYRFPE